MSIHRLGSINVCIKFYNNPSGRCWNTSLNRWQLEPSGATRGKVRGSPQPRNFIHNWPWISANLMTSHLIFHFEPTLLSFQHHQIPCFVTPPSLVTGQRLIVQMWLGGGGGSFGQPTIISEWLGLPGPPLAAALAIQNYWQHISH